MNTEQAFIFNQLTSASIIDSRAKRCTLVSWIKMAVHNYIVPNSEIVNKYLQFHYFVENVPWQMLSWHLYTAVHIKNPFNNPLQSCSCQTKKYKINMVPFFYILHKKEIREISSSHIRIPLFSLRKLIKVGELLRIECLCCAQNLCKRSIVIKFGMHWFSCQK